MRRGGGVVKVDGGWGEGDIVNTAKTYSKMVAHIIPTNLHCI